MFVVLKNYNIIIRNDTLRLSRETCWLGSSNQRSNAAIQLHGNGFSALKGGGIHGDRLWVVKINLPCIWSDVIIQVCARQDKDFIVKALES